MMELKNVGTRPIKIGPSSFIRPGESITINERFQALYLLRKHSDLRDITPKRGRKPRKVVVPETIEIKEEDENISPEVKEDGI